MLVTVWRHGEAVNATPDELRPLTARGEQTLEAAADVVRQVSETGITVVRHSPLVRTCQTAGIIGRVLGVTPELCEALAPGTDLRDPDSFLDADAPHQVLISHQPFVSQLITYWLDGDEVDPLGPGGWATIDLLAASQGGGSLVRARSRLY